MANGDALPIRSGCSTTSRRGRPVRERCSSESTKSRRPVDSTAESSSSNGQRSGLPVGSEADVVNGFRELDDEDLVAIIGPSISDNGLIVAPLCDEYRVPAINYTGGERTRSRVDVPLSSRLARRRAARARGTRRRRAASVGSPCCSTSPPSVGATPNASKPPAVGSAWKSPARRASAAGRERDRVARAPPRGQPRRPRLPRTRRRVPRRRARAQANSAGRFQFSRTRR